MSDGINDAEGREPFSLYKNRAKHKGKWGVWDCGYFYPDEPKKRKTKKTSKKKKI